MFRRLSASALLRSALILPVLLGCGLLHAQQWTAPTSEELTMTSQKGAPGAAAVYLDYEKTQDDKLHMYSVYVRLKVLTEEGKEAANVQLPYGQEVNGDFGWQVTDIGGRTIHADGTIIPFTGKPYQKQIEKTSEEKVFSKIFTLPDVQVGSIIEYRYKYRIPDHYFVAPLWMVQQEYYLRKAYFLWLATGEQLMDSVRDMESRGIAWTRVLPAGTEVKNTVLPATGMEPPTTKFELNVHDVAPLPHEEYMPPLNSFTYRVQFYYAFDSTQDEYWKSTGKFWQKSKERFLNGKEGLPAEAKTLYAPGDSDTVKLQKIYAAVMAMDNTRLSRVHDAEEDKAQGLKTVRTVADIWARKSGSDDQLAALFVALARGAGMKAYVMGVTNRERSIFWASWLSLQQLDDDVAIVSVDGKDMYFDPGQKYCPFGQLVWHHAGTSGLRETDSGTAVIATTPSGAISNTKTQRIADLTLNPTGEATGTVKIVWTGVAAVHWRQRNLRDGEGSMKRGIREWAEERLPAGLHPEITTVLNVDDYDKPLVVNFNVKGQLATLTSKRMIIPGQIFEANSKPLFPQPTRESAIYMEYPGVTLDATRIKFPPDWALESSPRQDKVMLQTLAGYLQNVDPPQPNSITVRREFDLGAVIFFPKEYQDVRTFYNNVASDDQQSIVLLASTAK